MRMMPPRPRRRPVLLNIRPHQCHITPSRCAFALRSPSPHPPPNRLLRGRTCSWLDVLRVQLRLRGRTLWESVCASFGCTPPAQLLRWSRSAVGSRLLSVEARRSVVQVRRCIYPIIDVDCHCVYERATHPRRTGLSRTVGTAGDDDTLTHHRPSLCCQRRLRLPLPRRQSPPPPSPTPPSQPPCTAVALEASNAAEPSTPPPPSPHVFRPPPLPPPIRE